MLRLCKPYLHLTIPFHYSALLSTLIHSRDTLCLTFATHVSQPFIFIARLDHSSLYHCFSILYTTLPLLLKTSLDNTVPLLHSSLPHIASATHNCAVPLLNKTLLYGPLPLHLCTQRSNTLPSLHVVARNDAIPLLNQCTAVPYSAFP